MHVNNIALSLCDVSSKKRELNNVLNILLFKILDVFIGIDSAQIYEMTALSKIKDNSLKLVNIDEVISFHKAVIKYISPMVVWINDETKNNGIIIESPLDIFDLNISSIKPLPPLVERYTKVVWGAFIKGDDIVLLLDLYKIDLIKLKMKS